jgi:hypothetical protein
MDGTQRKINKKLLDFPICCEDVDVVQGLATPFLGQRSLTRDNRQAGRASQVIVSSSCIPNVARPLLWAKSLDKEKALFLRPNPSAGACASIAKPHYTPNFLLTPESESQLLTASLPHQLTS